jgi:peroxiredoxin
VIAGICVALRLLLAAVFVVAALAKLADRSGSREALRAFGVPHSLSAPASLALPAAELATAAALIVPGLARWGALAALALLVGFCAGIVRAMRQGSEADCHCFGQLHSRPVGAATLARNGLLAVAAGFVALAGWENSGGNAFAWVGELSASGALALLGGLLFAALGLFCFQLLRQQGRLLMRIDALERRVAPGGDGSGAAPAVGLPPGTRAPGFSLPNVHGEMVALPALLERGKPLMLLFSDPGCGPCAALLPQLAAWQEAHRDDLTIALISRGEIEQNRAASEEHGIRPLLLQEDREVGTDYRAYGTPSAVLVAADATIASHVATGSEQIEELVREAVAGAAIGAPALGTGGASELRAIQRTPVSGGAR